MDEPINILVALDPPPEGLAAIRKVTDTLGSKIGAVDFVPHFPRETEMPVEKIEKYGILFAEFPPTNVRAMKRLKWYQLASAGFEHIYPYALHQLDILVSNASGVNDIPIAEWCLAMMLMFERDIRGLLECQQQRAWDRRAKFQSELRGRRVGIIGYGNIGRTVAGLCHALGLDVWAMGRRPIGPRPNTYVLPGTGDPAGVIPSRTFTLDQMADFLPHLDYLVLSTALTPDTRDLLKEQELRMLPATAVILNPSRGRLVEEGAMIRAMQENWIAGAALDTHYQYPMPPEHPLWAMPNVIMSPHISGSSGARHYLSRLWDIFAVNLDRYFKGEPLLNLVAPADLGRGVSK